MLAADIHAPRRIRLVEVAEPTLSKPARDGSRRILFQPGLGCLCGSDVPYFARSDPRLQIRVGHSLHEMVGTVVDTDGTRFRPGDRVLCLPMDQQGFCERFVAAESLAMPLDPATPDEHAVLAQPLGTVIHALQRLPNLLELDAAVVGQGPIGQLFCAALALLGARRIIAVDRLAARLAVSPRMGATHVVDASATDPIAAVRDLTGGAMPELVIEAVGHHEQALDLCVELCRPRGIVLMFGIPPAEPRGNPLFRVLRANLTLYSSSTGDLSRNFPLAMQWIDRRRIDVSPLLTHRFPLHQVQEAFDTFAERRDGALKVLIDFGAPRPRS